MAISVHNPQGARVSINLGEGIKIEALQQLNSEKLTREMINDLVKSNSQVREHDFTPDELSGNSPRITNGWTGSHFWTMKRWRAALVPSDPTIPQATLWAQFQELLDIYEHGTEIRVKLIPDRMGECKELQGNLTHDQLITQEAWKHGFVVEVLPGEPGYDDPDTLRIQLKDRSDIYHSAGLNKRDWLNLAHYDEHWGWHTGVFVPNMNAISAPKGEDIGKNSAPATAPDLRGEADAQYVLSDAAKAVQTMTEAITEGASMKKALEDAAKGEIFKRGVTIRQRLEQKVLLERDSDSAEQTQRRHARLQSMMRFFNSPDEGDQPKLDNPTQEMRAHLAQIFRAIGHGHEMVQTASGLVPLVTKEKHQFWNRGTRQYELRETDRNVVSREAFLDADWFRWAEWLIAYQQSSIFKVRNDWVKSLGERTKQKNAPDLSKLTILSGVTTMVIFAVASKLGPTGVVMGLVFGLAVGMAVHIMTGLHDEDHPTGRESKLVLGTFVAIVAIAILVVNLHRVDQESSSVALRSAAEQNSVAQGHTTQAQWDTFNQWRAQMIASQNAAEQKAQPQLPVLGAFDIWKAIGLVMTIVVLLILRWLIGQYILSKHYDPILVRSSRWRRVRTQVIGH